MLNYKKLLNWAIDRGLETIKKIEEKDGYYMDDALVFRFPPFVNSGLSIYALDGGLEDLLVDFDDSTLLVYSGGEWVHLGSWQAYIESYFTAIQELYDEEVAEKELAEEARKAELQKKLEEKLKRFELVFQVDAIKPEITLIGEKNIELEYGEEYVEQGATAEDDIDGTITEDIVITGEVNSKELGEQIITYTVSDSAGNQAKERRFVTVVDTVPPVITVLGTNPITVEFGSVYEDEGATAEDNADGVITGSVKTTGVEEVNTSLAGDYNIVYSVSDKSGNTAEETRKVTVEEEVLPNIVSVETTSDKTVEYGTKKAALSLPENLTVTLDDESTKNVPVVWDGGTPVYDGNKAGDYSFEGVLTIGKTITNTNDVKSTIKIAVKAEVLPNIVSVEDLTQIDAANGTMKDDIGLPATVEATMDKGGAQTVNVTWDDGTPAYDGDTAGTYVFKGTLEDMFEEFTNADSVTASVSVVVAEADPLP